ncbi:MAG: nucleobase:cation symporter-2 family protein [Alloprevotella sp.]|nr:nucleobase:cation symporter-2 family protein [Alloprevotella sp.]
MATTDKNTTIDAERNARTGLIYGLNDRPPLRETIFAALQHLLAIFVAIVTPPLIIAGALGLDTETTSFLVSMSLMVSGVATFIQCKRLGSIGCGLLCIQGTSFSFIGPIISAGLAGGLPAIFGATVAGSVVEMFVSRVLKYARRIITPLVSGIVVTLIGMSLIKVGIVACGGGDMKAPNFGSFENVGIAALVLVLIIIFNRSNNRYLRMGSIVIGLAVGYALSWWLGMVDFGSVQSYGGFNYPNPFKYGLKFDISSIIGLGLVYLITSIEAYGDITANSLISGEPVEGDTFMKRAEGGILADGFNSMLAGLAFSSFPNSIFAQNNGMIQLTGVASRYVGYFIAAMLVLLGIFPAVGIVFSLMPSPVLGGATLLMFGTVAAAGIRIIASQTINRKATLVMAISFSLGLSVEMVPEILSQLPETMRNIFSSGITTGGLAAIISNLVIRIKE